MQKILHVIIIGLFISYQSASAEGLLPSPSFGTGANTFTMDFVTIGNPNNVADATGLGSVAYSYSMAKYEVSRDQITKANSAGNLGITMYDMTDFGGNGANRPGTGIDWNEAATYVNWLNTSTGYEAAYKFVGGTFQLWSSTDAGYNANNMYRNSLAKYVIANSDEWHKGAYGKPGGGWSIFPTGSDSAPTAVASGTDANTAVYDQDLNAGPADITNAGGLSSYGTMGQAANVFEWTETAFDGINDSADEERELRGGSWLYDTSYFTALTASSDRYYGGIGPVWDDASPDVGFRVAMVPEPSTGLLVVLGLGGLLLKRRKTVTV
jgi:formylglycine-generating enzyme required for sulfatase activity